MVGTWIRERRKSLDLSQSDLATRVGASQAQVSCWERDKYAPSSVHLQNLIAVLGPVAPASDVPVTLPARPKGTPPSRFGASTSAAVELNVGDFVCIEGTRDGVGKLVEIHGRQATVEYFDSVATRITRPAPLELLRPKSLQSQTRCYWIQEDCWRVGRVREKVDGAYLVVCHQVHSTVSEQELFVRWARPLEDPTEVLAARANESPLFHRSRLIFVDSVLAQRASSRGLSGVLSARTELHHHQVETARRILEDPLPRYILADEVGLGKTIEAGFVIRQFLLDTPDGRVLVLVPPFLVRQWQEELRSKFFVNDFGTACRVEDYASMARSRDDGVDLLVIDEAHHLAACAASDVPSFRDIFTRVARTSARTPRLLLLSATPLLHNESTFLAMLHLIDAVAYPLDGYEAFRARVAARAAVGRVLLGFTEDAPPFLLDQPLRDLRALFPEDTRLARMLVAVEAVLEGSDDERAVCIRAARVHLSETHRISRRLLRTRRSDELSETFPVRGRAGISIELATDDDRIAADAWLDQWRETVLLDAATEIDADVRRAREAALARVFDVLLPRACSSVQSLSAAVRYRAVGGSAAAASADLTSADAMTLRTTTISAAEVEVLQQFLERFDEFGPDARASRLADLLEDRTDCKIVVFASFLHLATEVLAYLAGRFGKECVARHTTDMAPGDVDAEVARFRCDPRCRALISDSSGEEGRNLQFADLVVHYDLPWSPNRIEQRLGRLDRYGAGTTVECIAFGDSPDDRTYHDRWRRLLDEDFALFSRSVAAFQFAIDDLMPLVRKSLFYGSTGAFGPLATEIRAALAKESQAIAEQDVLDSIEAVDRDATFFRELEEHDDQHHVLRKGFERWAGTGSGDQASLQLACASDVKNQNIVEYRPILQAGSRGQTLVPVDWLLRWFPTGKIRGTFARSTAIRTPDIRLMRIGDPFYDEVRAFGEWDDRGRAFAFWRYRPAFSDRDTDWAFRLDYIVEADPEPALGFVLGKSRDDSAAKASLQRRLDGLLPPYLHTFWVDAAGDLVTDAERLRDLDEPYDKRAGDVNLRPVRFERADHELRLGDWSETCRRVRRRSEELLRNSPTFLQHIAECRAKAEKYLGSRVEVVRARAERTGALATERSEAEREELLAQTLLAGVRAPRLRLEAVGFVCLAGMPLRDEVGDDA